MKIPQEYSCHMENTASQRSLKRENNKRAATSAQLAVKLCLFIHEEWRHLGLLGHETYVCFLMDENMLLKSHEMQDSHTDSMPTDQSHSVTFHHNSSELLTSSEHPYCFLCIDLIDRSKKEVIRFLIDQTTYHFNLFFDRSTNVSLQFVF